jgi:hypothetical protein
VNSTEGASPFPKKEGEFNVLNLDKWCMFCPDWLAKDLFDSKSFYTGVLDD